MSKSFAEVIMNPVRQRIAQYLMLHETATVNEIAEDLRDVSRPSLYRHVNILLNAGCVEVVSEKAVRGAMERTYRLVPQPMPNPTHADMASLIQGILGSTTAAFMKYFSGACADPQRDMLSVSSAVIMMTDEEMMEFLHRLGDVYSSYVHNQSGEGRKPRNLMFISAPVVEERGKDNAQN